MKVFVDSYSWGIALCTTLVLSFSFHIAVIWNSLQANAKFPNKLLMFCAGISVLAILVSMHLYYRKEDGSDLRIFGLLEAWVFTLFTILTGVVYVKLSAAGLFLINNVIIASFILLMVLIWAVYFKSPFRWLLDD